MYMCMIPVHGSWTYRKIKVIRGYACERGIHKSLTKGSQSDEHLEAVANGTIGPSLSLWG